MNSTINLTHFAAMLSKATGFPESSAKQFVIEFAEALTAALAKGNEVKIKGLGTFTPSEDPVVGVAFIPDAEMAEEVNAPFAMFEAVYLDDEVTDDMINSAGGENLDYSDNSDESDRSDKSEQEIEKVLSPDVAPEPETLITPEPEAVPEAEAVPEPEAVPEAESTPDPEVAPELKTEETPDPEPVVSKIPLAEERIIYVERRGPGWGWVVAALLAGAAIGYFLPEVIRGLNSPAPETTHEVIVKAPKSDPLNVSVTSTQVSSESTEDEDKPADTENDAPTEVQEEATEPVVTEVVDGRTYLTTIASRYYGNPDFWAYIYEENKDILGHPDRVRPGTVVVVPPKSKYNIDASNPESVRAAKELQAEIYSRF